MTAERIHLVRHGEVLNPDGILYGRLAGFPLSERGVTMAQAAADELAREGRRITRIVSSPLERAMESAAPIARATELPVETLDGIIEAASHLQGGRFRMDLSVFTKPKAWRYLVNPLRPSWGEPFVEVAARVDAAMREVWETTPDGDAVLVSHQLPIWMAHRRAVGKSLSHDPRKRRCALSSITSFELRDGRFVEVGYRDPARELIDASRDVGAV